MLSRSLSLPIPDFSACSLSPAQCHIFVLLICEMWTRHIQQLRAQLDKCRRISFRFEGIAAVQEILRRWGSGTAARISNVLQAFRLAAPWLRLYRVPHPSNATLRRKQTQLLLAIDTFVVPQSSAAAAVGSPPSERLREFWPHFPVTLKVTWLVDIGSLTQKCRHSLSKLCRAVGLKSAVPFLLLRS